MTDSKENPLKHTKVQTIPHSLPTMSRPGNPALFSSFYNPGIDLLTIGAYTGFKNTGDLKRLLICRPMLEIATAMMNDGCLQELDWDAIFTSIEAFHADTDVLETQFGEGVNLRERYPEININRVEMEDLHNAAEYFAKFQANREARAGAYLYRLMQRLKKYAEEDTTERMFESEEARNAFGLALNRVSVTLPNPDPANVVVPQQILNPMSKKGESIMEVFNRLWYLLQKLFYDIKSKTPKNILLCKKPFQSRKIPGQYIPVWMRNDTQQHRKTAFEALLPSKAFAYSWGKVSMMKVRREFSRALKATSSARDFFLMIQELRMKSNSGTTSLTNFD